jgi:hypothetical protein
MSILEQARVAVLDDAKEQVQETVLGTEGNLGRMRLVRVVACLLTDGFR